MFYIPQLGGYDCAFTCLKILLAHVHKDRNYLFLPHENRRYNFYELVDVARNYGTELLGVKVDIPQELFKCKKFPIIVTLNKRRGVKHSVIVLKASKKRVKLYDPAVGKVYMNTEAFFKEWTFRALVIGQHSKMKCPMEFDDYIDKKDKVLLPIIQIVSSLFLLAGTFFVSDKYPLYIPIILFSSFVVFEFIFRRCLVNAMKRMDEKILSYHIDKGDRGYWSVYKNIEKYREKSLSLVPNILYNFIVSLFITVLLIINDYYNFIYVILPLAIALIDCFIYCPIYKAHNLELINKESEIDEVSNDEQFRMKSEEIHKKAYRVASIKNLYSYLEIGALLGAIVLVMSLTGVINLTYGLFYLCITIFLKNTFVKILESGKDIEEAAVTRAKLLNTLKKENNN